MFLMNEMPVSLDGLVTEQLAPLCTSTLGHLRDYGFLKGLSPLFRPTRFVGCAVTVRIPAMDSTALHVALDSLRPGDVLVVEHSGDHTRSCFGGVTAFTAKARGAVGAVFDAPVNDFDEIVGYGFPLYSRGVTSHTTRILGIEGAINVPITVAGVVVAPGDVVWADNDGVAILDRAEVGEIAQIVAGKEAAEPELRTAIQGGAKISEFSGAAALFAKGAVTA